MRQCWREEYQVHDAACRRTVSNTSRTTAVTSPFQRRPFARARKQCLAFPETVEALAWGHPNFRAGRKTFCAFEVVRGRPSIAFRLSPPDMDLVLQRDEFFSTPYGRGL